MFRALILAASALTTGISLGKRALGDEIDRRKIALIKQSAEEARQEIKDHSGAFLAQTSRDIARNAAIRLAFLLGLWGLRALSILPRELFIIAAGTGLIVFLAIDLWRNRNTFKLIFGELRRHNWNPKRALRESIAAAVFDQVMSRASDYPIGRTHRLLLAMAGEHPNAIAKEVAVAVAHVARQTSWSDMRPFLILAGINISTFWIFYSAAMWLVFNAA